ncbi:hypothetical protein [Spirosoma validum]|uniref:TlpA family protein disulfide reductase n=1 Tax=Spirosoma validum TaxID=2771355 RepID=A0A927GG80_9BACT|nr:hypothetical protein [Spirosoma validum]MBD2756325.1 hypothetical protein [Spirosoma validum]
MLGADSTFKGIHINIPPGESFNAFWQAYQFSIIPRYLLIDQQGKLINVNAVRPSASIITETIDKQLK